MSEGKRFTFASMLRGSSFDEEAFKNIVLDSKFLIPNGDEAVHRALRYLHQIDKSYKVRASRVLFKRMEDKAQATSLPIICKCFMRNTFAVAPLANDSDTSLLNCYESLCSRLFSFDLQEVASNLLAVTENQIIAGATVQALALMVQSENPFWSQYRKQPENLASSLDRIILLVIIARVFGYQQHASLSELTKVWMQYHVKSRPHQAKPLNCFELSQYILKVSCSLGLMNPAETADFLCAVTGYFYNITIVNNPRGYYDTVMATNAAYKKHIMDLFQVQLQQFLEAEECRLLLTNYDAIPMDAALLVKFANCIVNKTFEEVDASYAVEVLCDFLKCRGKLQNRGLQNAYEQILSLHKGNFSDERIQDFESILLRALASHGRDVSIIDGIPPNVMLQFCEREGVFDSVPSMKDYLLRYFEVLGRTLYSQCAIQEKTFDSIPYDYTILFNIYLKCGGIGNGEQMIDHFLNSLVAIFTGISRLASANRTRVAYEGPSYWINCVIKSISWVAAILAGIENDGGFAKNDVVLLEDRTKTALRSKLFLNSTFQQIFRDIGANSKGFITTFSLILGPIELGGEMPFFYLWFCEVLAERLVEQDLLKAAGQNQDESSICDTILKQCISMLNGSLESRMCHLSVNYVKCAFEHATGTYLSLNPFSPPSSLKELPYCFEQLSKVKHEHSLTSNQKKLEEYAKEVVESIETKKLSRKDVNVAKHNIGSIIKIAEGFKIESEINAQTMDKLSEEFLELDKSVVELGNTLTFLYNRKLCAAESYNDWKEMLTKLADPSVQLVKMSDDISLILTELGLGDNILTILKTFSGESDLFGDRFGTCANIPGTPEEVINVITEKTLTAFRDLEMLVFDGNVRIKDFEVNLSGVIAEFQGHGRRQRKLERELQAVANFFVSNANLGKHWIEGEDRMVPPPNQLMDHLEKLNSAFTLVKYRDVLISFKTALKGLKMDYLISPSLEDLVNQVMDNFLISRAPDILRALTSSLGGLELFDLKIIGKLASENELSAGLLLLFFRRYNSQESFDTAVEHAQNRCAGNPHASKVLMKLHAMRNLLSPFWSSALQVTSLKDIKDHFKKLVLIHGKEAHELTCPTLEELSNLIENWAECEIYFRDGTDSGDSGDIIRRVALYRKTGKFVATYHAHLGGAVLAFAYEGAAQKHVVLSPDVLQEHVQWAVLLGGGVDTVRESEVVVDDANDAPKQDPSMLPANESSNVLEEFVRAFVLAQDIHSLRLQLELAGHPDYQATADNRFSPIADTCLCAHLEETVQHLLDAKDRWERDIVKTCGLCPRLSLLPQRARVHFLIALRTWQSNYRDGHNGTNGDSTVVDGPVVIYPYVLQSFPEILSERSKLFNALTNVMNGDQLKNDFCGEPDYLKNAIALLSMVEKALQDDGVIYAEDINKPGTISRIDAFGADELQMYVHHLEDFLSTNNAMPGLPSCVLWGHPSVEMEAIQDFLRAVSSGLCPVAHVIDADKILPRVREELLRGLQNELVKCSVVVLFADHNGVDAFRHYSSQVASKDQVENLGDRKNSYYKSAWPCRLSLVNEKDNDTSSLKIHVVAGELGGGKSRWIEEASRSCGATQQYQLIVHEGFHVTTLIDQYKVHPFEDTTLYINVTEYGDLALLNRFLHNLIVLGLILDEKSGQSIALLPNLKLSIFVELPSLSANPINNQRIWPPREEAWTAMQHPYISKLSALAVFVPASNFVSVRACDPFIADHQARFVCLCMKQYYEHNGQIDTRLLPDPAEVETASIGNEECESILTRLLKDHNDATTKRFITFMLRVLYSRFAFLARMQRLMFSDSQFEFFERYRGHLNGIFMLMILEALSLVKESNDDCSIFCIFPSWSTTSTDLEFDNNDDEGNDEEWLDSLPVEAQLEILLCCKTKTSPYVQSCIRKFPSIHVLETQSDVPSSKLAEIRALVAPLFGMKDTGMMLRNLMDAGHLLTPDSLWSILHLNLRKHIHANVIYEGETGCGKTQNLKLLSHLLNSDAELFTNLKLHLLAITQVAVKHLSENNPLTIGNDVTEEDVAAYDNAAKEILSFSTSSASFESSSTEKLLQAIISWVRQGEQGLANAFGRIVFAYFAFLFGKFPLYQEGLSEVQVLLFKRLQLWLSKNDNERSIIQKLAIEASYMPFLFAEGSLSELVWPLSLSFCEDELAENNGHETNDNDDDLKLFETENALEECLEQLVKRKPASLFYRILADDGLTVEKWRDFISKVATAAKRIFDLDSSATVCIFVDETNTARALGMVTEVFVTHSLDGIALPTNIVFVGAINPFTVERQLGPNMDFTKYESNSPHNKNGPRNDTIDIRKEDDSADYLASVPYIVKPLSSGLHSLLIKYPNLHRHGEAIFLRDYLLLHICIPAPSEFKEQTKTMWSDGVNTEDYLNEALTMILRAQELVRTFRIHRVHMSMRNLIRATDLLKFYLKFSVPSVMSAQGEPANYVNVFLPKASIKLSGVPYYRQREMIEQRKEQMLHALIMAISITYMLQLPNEGHVAVKKASVNFREVFLREIVEGWGSWYQSSGAAFSSSHVEKRCNQWHQVMYGSFEHIWSFATIPKGLAKTNALMEAFYANILVAENKMGLLVTGPPGCGKTLSFNLACENLRGPSLNHSIVFQHLRKAAKFMYQCSASSTGPELAARFHDAYVQQAYLDTQQLGKHICIVGVDEAGLPPENRQALKSVHDVLEERVVATTMMSNTTLDAAKTSRMLQLLLNQANLEDLEQLALGILVNDDQRFSQPKDVILRWEERIKGLCAAFYSLSQVILYDNWFHSRDFIFLCRYLRRAIANSPPAPSLFTASILVEGLRRHFQTVNDEQFPQLSTHFLDHCGFTEIDDLLLSSRVLDTLRLALADKVDEETDATAAHCRYILIVDPTDSENAADLLFTTNLLDQTQTKVITLSDFSEDATPTRQTAVLAQIKRAIEVGECLLLKNSSVLQSALYDVINRHYVINVTADPLHPGKVIREAYANIALGSFSRYVKVHPNFRLIIHVPKSQLPFTPLPFLNRLEKYTLSVRNTLDERIEELSNHPPSSLRAISSPEQRKAFFAALREGVEGFVDFLGGNSTFYGFAASEAVPATILNSLSDFSLASSSFFRVPKTKLELIMLRAKHNESPVGPNEDDAVEDLYFDPNNLGARMRDIIRSFNFQVLQNAKIENIFRLRNRLPAVYLREYLERQEHLSVAAILKDVFYFMAMRRADQSAASCFEPLKLVAYTRTDALIQRLGCDKNANHLLTGTVGDASSYEHHSVKTFTVSSSDDFSLKTIRSCKDLALCIFQLSAFKSGGSCEKALRACLSTNSGQRVLLLVADMMICTTNQITFCKQIVDAEISYLREEMPHLREKRELPEVIFVLHVPSNQLVLRPCYQTIPLNGWSSVYVDSFSLFESSEEDGIDILAGIPNLKYDAASIADGVPESKDEEAPVTSSETSLQTLMNSQAVIWLRVAFSLELVPSLEDVRQEFNQIILWAIGEAVKRCSFNQLAKRSPSMRRLKEDDFYSLIGLRDSILAYGKDDKEWITNMIWQRSYLVDTLLQSFSVVWGWLLETTVEDACDRLSRGSTSLGLVACIRTSHKWLLSDFITSTIRRDLSSQWSLEALARLPIGDLSDLQSAVSTEKSEEDEILFLRECEVRDGNIALMAFTIHVLRSSVFIRALDEVTSKLFFTGNGKVIETIDCSKFEKASALPLFHSFNQQLQPFLHKSKNSARQSNLDNSEQQFLLHLRKSISATNAELSHALTIVDKLLPVWKMWQKDFIILSLGFARHNETELDILLHLAENFDINHIRHSTEEFSSNVLWWVLQEKALKTYLLLPSKMLLTCRSVLQAEDLLALKSQISNENYVSVLFNCCITVLWSNLKKALILRGDGEPEKLQRWMVCMRDLVNLQELPVKELAANEEMLVVISHYLIMVSFYKCFGNGVSCTPNALQCYEGLQGRGISLEYPNTIKVVLTTDDPLKDILLVLLICSYSMPKEEVQATLIDILLLMMQWNHCILSSSFKVVVLIGIIGIPFDHKMIDWNKFLDKQFQEPCIPALFEKVFSTLTLESRSELLKRLILLNRNEMEEILESVLECCAATADEAIYIPSVILAGMIPWSKANVFEAQQQSTQFPIDAPSWEWLVPQDCEYVIIRSLRLLYLLDKRKDNKFGIHDVAKSLSQWNDSRRHGQLSRIVQMYRIIEAMDLLSLAADALSSSQPTLESESSRVNLLANIHADSPIIEATQKAVAIAPRALSLFLLSRLKDLMVVTSVLGDLILLEALNINWWHAKCVLSVPDNVRLSQDEMNQCWESQKEGHAKLVCIHVAKALINQEFLLQRWHLPNRQQLLESSGEKSDEQEESPLRKLSHDFVKTILNEDRASSLAMNKHIPIIANMTQFVREKLSYRLKDVDEARMMTMEQALTLLPPYDRPRGRELFRKFLIAWEQLRQQFHSFNNCGYEIAAAGEIPQLTDERGANPTLLGHLVELSGSKAHESLPVRMLERRLITQTNDALLSAVVANIRSHEALNPYECLAETAVHEEMLSRFGVDDTKDKDRLLTGPFSSPEAMQALDDFLVCHSQWRINGSKIVLPNLDGAWPAIDFTAAVQQQQDREAREAQLAAHLNGIVICPNCGSLSQRIDGCNVMTCGNPSDPHSGRATLRVGCGTIIDAVGNRVPDPKDGVLHPRFQPKTVHLPSEIIRDSLPKLPDITEPSGYHEVNFVAMAKFLLAKVIHGRVCIKVDQSYFEPLAMLDSVENVDSDALRMLIHRLPKEEISSTLQKGQSWKDHIRRLRKEQDKITTLWLPASTVADVNLRLIVAADHLSNIFDDQVQNENKVESSLEVLRQSVHRLDDKRLVACCEQLLELCIVVINMMLEMQCRSNHTQDEDSTVQKTVQSLKEDVCGTLMSELTSNGRNWAPVLKKDIGSRPISFLPAIARMFALAGMKGSESSLKTVFRSSLSKDDSERMEKLVNSITEETNESRWDEVQTQLKELGSILAKNEETMTRCPDRNTIKDLPFMTQFILSNEFSREFLGVLKICHYGEVKRAIRRFISEIDYKKLSRDYQPSMEQISSVLQHDNATPIAEAPKRETITVYIEHVPPEWIEQEEMSVVGKNEEYVLTAPAILRQQQLEQQQEQHHNEYEENAKEETYEEDNRIDEVSAVHLTDHQPTTLDLGADLTNYRACLSIKDDLLPLPDHSNSTKTLNLIPTPISLPLAPLLNTRSRTDEAGDSSHVLQDSDEETTAIEALLPPSPPRIEPAVVSPASSSHAATDTTSRSNLPSPQEQKNPLRYHLAWLEFEQWRNEALSSLMKDLGVKSGEDLQYCDEEDIQKMAGCLKQVPKQKVLQIVGFVAPSVSIQHREEVWTMLRDPEYRLSDGLLDLLEELGVAKAADLQYLTMNDFEELFRHLKKVPAKKIRGHIEVVVQHK
eukprot:gene9047-9983_t